MSSTKPFGSDTICFSRSESLAGNGVRVTRHTLCSTLSGSESPCPCSVHWAEFEEQKKKNSEDRMKREKEREKRKRTKDEIKQEKRGKTEARSATLHSQCPVLSRRANRKHGELVDERLTSLGGECQ